MNTIKELNVQNWSCIYVYSTNLYFLSKKKKKLTPTTYIVNSPPKSERRMILKSE